MEFELPKINVSFEYDEEKDEIVFVINGVEKRVKNADMITEMEKLQEQNTALEQEPCEDAISRKELLNEITEIDYGCNMDIFTNEVREIVNELPSVQTKPKTDWISVSDRLPENCGMYIVTRKIYDCPDTAPIIMSDESWFDGQNTWHNDNRINHERGYLSDVIAWMPLPEPYKAESEDKE